MKHVFESHCSVPTFCLYVGLTVTLELFASTLPLNYMLQGSIVMLV